MLKHKPLLFVALVMFIGAYAEDSDPFNNVTTSRDPLQNFEEDDVEAQLFPKGSNCVGECPKGQYCTSGQGVLGDYCTSKILSSCLSPLDTVQTPFGVKKMSEINAHDLVLSVSEDGKPRYEKIIVDTHPLPDVDAVFFKIRTRNDEIRLTSQHYIYTGDDVRELKLTKSNDISVGDHLIAYSSTDGVIMEEVEKIEVILARGITNPIVANGRILVNNILTSVYSDDIPKLGVIHQHQLFWLVRQVFNNNLLKHLLAIYASNGLPLWAHLTLKLL